MAVLLPRTVSLDLHPRLRPDARAELRRYAEKQTGPDAAAAWQSLVDLEARIFSSAAAARSRIASGESLRQDGSPTNARAELDRALGAVDRASRVGPCAVQAQGQGARFLL